MKLFTIFTFLWTVVTSKHGRIFGGFDAPEGSAPFIVSININGHHHCGGSIITQRWILSAAHCVRYPVILMHIYAGSNILGRLGQWYGVRRAISHHWYEARRQANDIGVLQTDRDIEFNDRVQPIELQVNEIPYIVQGATLYGWGVCLLA